MALDAYSPCPCGSGKKVKFCCPREHVSDYLKVFELIGAEQFAAASELTDRLLAKAPQQICFLALRATFLEPDDESVRDIAQRLAAVAPEHPVSLAAQAIVTTYEGDLVGAINRLQDSIEHLENAVPTFVLTTIAFVAEFAYRAEEPFAAHAHANYVLTLTKNRHSDSINLVRELHGDLSIPLAIKDTWIHRFGSVFQSRWDERLSALAARGKWRRAREEAKQALQREPDNHYALGIYALMSAWLAQDDDAERAWSQLGEMPDIPESIATDALLIAQYFFQRQDDSGPSIVQLEYQVPNTDALMERLLSQKRAAVSKEDLRNYGDEENPPPKALFYLLDREIPEIKPGIPHTDFPHILAHLMVFGKQTDRDARVEVLTQSPSAETSAQLDEVLGDLVTRPPKERALPLERHALQEMLGQLYGVDELDVAERVRIEQQRIAHVVNVLWPARPQALLHHKSPEEAAQDPALKRRVTAALLELATTPPFDLWDQDYGPLWERLGLHEPLPALESDQVSPVGLTNLMRVEALGMEDQQLAAITGLATAYNARRAARSFASVLAFRPIARRDYDLTQVFEYLKVIANYPEQKLYWTNEAIQWCREVSQPTGRWLVEQFVWEMLCGHADKAMQTYREVITHHRDEPEAMQDLFQVLVRFGFIGPDGKMRAMPDEAAPAAQAPAAPSALWTPGQGMAAAPAQKTESKLWVPGRD